MSDIMKKSYMLAVAALTFAAFLSICAFSAASDSSADTSAADAYRCFASEETAQERFVLMVEGEQLSIVFSHTYDRSYTKVDVTYGDYSASFTVPAIVADKMDIFINFIVFEIVHHIECEKYINTTTTTAALTAEEVPAVPLFPAHPIVPLSTLIKIAGFFGYDICDIYWYISERYVNTTTTTVALTAEEVPAVPLVPAHPIVPLSTLIKIACFFGYDVCDIFEYVSEGYVNTTTSVPIVPLTPAHPTISISKLIEIAGFFGYDVRDIFEYVSKIMFVNATT